MILFSRLFLFVIFVSDSILPPLKSSLTQAEESSLALNETEDTVYLPSSKRKVLNLAPAEDVPRNFADYLKYILNTILLMFIHKNF